MSKHYLTENADLMKEWNYEKNRSLNPSEVTFGSNKKAWWRCSKGHEWQAIIVNRVNGNGCPYCANNKLLQGYNDLATTNPKLASEWNTEKNGALKSSEVFEKARKKVWWICEKGHEWQAPIYSRAAGAGCPICNNETQTSFPEQTIFYYLSKTFRVENRRKIYNNEIDIFLPDYQIGIEYDGRFFHRNRKEKEERKDKQLAENGIKVYRIKEYDGEVVFDGDKLFYYKYQSYKYGELEKLIALLVEQIGRFIDKKIDIDINVERDIYDIKKRYILSAKENSILTKDENLRKFWDEEKNGNINIEFVNYGTATHYWWHCDVCGSSWKRAPINMIGKGCPYCNGTIIKSGFNDFSTLYPSLLKEWDYEKNTKEPQEYAPNSNKKVWWKCPKGHSYQATICHRVNGRNCPICSNKTIKTGTNDLTTTHPKLASEWDYELNSPLLPTQVSAGAKKRVWWKCSQCGHHWEAYIYNRSRGDGCPKCSNKERGKSFTEQRAKQVGSFAQHYPHLLKEWDYDKNNLLGIYPDKISSGSHKKVWWTCSQCGYKWETYVYNRSKGHGCPHCSKKKK